jgi:PPOX class probable F420-dependent enzyme
VRFEPIYAAQNASGRRARETWSTLTTYVVANVDQATHAHTHAHGPEALRPLMSRTVADEQQLLDLIATSREGVLAGVTRGGYPHLTNILYVWDAEKRIARVSTTATRVKGRIFRRNPHAALHVPGPHFWSYAVAQGDAETSEVAATPGDDACRELFGVHSTFYDELEEEPFYRQMIEAKRLVVRLHVESVYGVVMDRPPGA